jgi:predicted nicotinamide N-methyase
MLHSANVTLRRSSEAPLRRLRDVYGAEDGAETLLEHFVLAGERRMRGRAPPLSATLEVARRWAMLVTLLADLSAYGALGAMGGAEPHFCQRLQPLLTRLMKCILSGGFDVASSEAAAENDFDVDELLQAASRALANCSEGVARRCADTTLEVHLEGTSHAAADSPATLHDQDDSSESGTLRVRFGFADYTSGETGAMLWAGAVGLSLYLIENYEAIIAKRAREVASSTGQVLRVIELGCGPALVSLVLAMMATREKVMGEVPCWLDVTDVSATVVDEARRSFQRRNGPALSRMLATAATAAGEESDGDHENNGDSDRATRTMHREAISCSSGSASPAGFRVRPFILDFADIPGELCGVYDVVVASDVVYDHAIAAHVAPALEALLKPGGIALLCCEAHRDGMSYFTRRIRAGQVEAAHLRVVDEVRDVQTVLARLQMLTSLTASTCSLIRIEKTEVTGST